MNCQKAQNLIESYLENRISDSDLEEFIYHVRNCPSCHEMLEIYYVVDLAKRYMEEDEEESYNIIQVLERDMSRKLERMNKKQKVRGFMFFTSMFLIGIVTILVCFSLDYV